MFAWARRSLATVGGSIPTASFDPNMCGYDRNCIPQRGTAEGIDADSYRLMYRLAYRNFGGAPVQESLVGNITVTGSTSNPAHGAIRWFEFRNAGDSIATPAVLCDARSSALRAFGMLPSHKSPSLSSSSVPLIRGAPSLGRMCGSNSIPAPSAICSPWRSDDAQFQTLSRNQYFRRPATPSARSS